MSFKKCLLTLICLCCMGCSYFHESDDDSIHYEAYKAAYQDLTDGNYDAAIEAYSQMDGYLDSIDLYYEAVYRRLLVRIDHYMETMEDWQDVEDDYLMLSYNNRNEKLLEQQGIYLQLLQVAVKMNHEVTFDCENDFYYYGSEGFWTMYQTPTVLNSEILIQIVEEYVSKHGTFCRISEE